MFVKTRIAKQLTTLNGHFGRFLILFSLRRQNVMHTARMQENVKSPFLTPQLPIVVAAWREGEEGVGIGSGGTYVDPYSKCAQGLGVIGIKVHVTSYPSLVLLTLGRLLSVNDTLICTDTKETSFQQITRIKDQLDWMVPINVKQDKEQQNTLDLHGFIEKVTSYNKLLKPGKTPIILPIFLDQT